MRGELSPPKPTPTDQWAETLGEVSAPKPVCVLEPEAPLHEIWIPA